MGGVGIGLHGRLLTLPALGELAKLKRGLGCALQAQLRLYL